MPFYCLQAWKFCVERSTNCCIGVLFYVITLFLWHSKIWSLSLTFMNLIIVSFTEALFRFKLFLRSHVSGYPFLSSDSGKNFTIIVLNIRSLLSLTFWNSHNVNSLLFIMSHNSHQLSSLVFILFSFCHSECNFHCSVFQVIECFLCMFKPIFFNPYWIFQLLYFSTLRFLFFYMVISSLNYFVYTWFPLFH